MHSITNKQKNPWNVWNCAPCVSQVYTGCSHWRYEAAAAAACTRLVSQRWCDSKRLCGTFDVHCRGEGGLRGHSALPLPSASHPVRRNPVSSARCIHCRAIVFALMVLMLPWAPADKRRRRLKARWAQLTHECLMSNTPLLGGVQVPSEGRRVLEAGGRCACFCTHCPGSEANDRSG